MGTARMKVPFIHHNAVEARGDNFKFFAPAPTPGLRLPAWCARKPLYAAF